MNDVISKNSYYVMVVRSGVIDNSPKSIVEGDNETVNNTHPGIKLSGLFTKLNRSFSSIIFNKILMFLVNSDIYLSLSDHLYRNAHYICVCLYACDVCVCLPSI